jgi:hypothetical protein
MLFFLALFLLILCMSVAIGASGARLGNTAWPMGLPPLASADRFGPRIWSAAISAGAVGRLL